MVIYKKMIKTKAKITMTRTNKGKFFTIRTHTIFYQTLKTKFDWGFKPFWLIFQISRFIPCIENKIHISRRIELIVNKEIKDSKFL